MQGIDGVFTANNGNLRCTAIVLRDGRHCLFSPVSGLGADACLSLNELGQVAYLFAPNHYHNKALVEYATAFPTARVCAAPDAAVRLEKVTGLKYQTLEDIKSNLPDQFDLLKPDGLKTGEVWLRHSAGKTVTWFVADAFSGPKTLDTSGVCDTPAMLGTFPGFAVRDKKTYVDWVQAQLKEDLPTRVVPCHGAIVQSTKLTGLLRKLVDDKLVR